MILVNASAGWHSGSFVFNLDQKKFPRITEGLRPSIDLLKELELKHIFEI